MGDDRFRLLVGMYCILGKTKEEQKMTKKSLKSTEYDNHSDLEVRQTILGELGNISFSKGDPNQALKYYEQALSIARTIKDRKKEAATLGNIGNAYTVLGDLQNAHSILKY